jgi:hypothetical protein
MSNPTNLGKRKGVWIQITTNTSENATSFAKLVVKSSDDDDDDEDDIDINNGGDDISAADLVAAMVGVLKKRKLNNGTAEIVDDKKQCVQPVVVAKNAIPSNELPKRKPGRPPRKKKDDNVGRKTEKVHKKAKKKNNVESKENKNGNELPKRKPGRPPGKRPESKENKNTDDKEPLVPREVKDPKEWETIYDGTIYPTPSGWATQYFDHENKERPRPTACFATVKFGGDNLKAKAAAEAWRNKESDRRGKTKWRPIPKGSSEIKDLTEWEADYGGTVYWTGVSWCAQVPGPSDDRITKTFNPNSFGNDKNAAKNAAEKWRRGFSDDMGLTKWIKIPFAAKGPVNTNIQRHIAGMFDGDGTVVADQNGIITVAFSQNGNQMPDILLHIQRYYGGSIVSHKVKNRPTSRTQHNLIWYNEKTTFILGCLQKHCILKRVQVDFAIKHMTDPTESGDQVYRTLQWMKNHYGMVDLDVSRINEAWLSGFVDAEGTVAVQKSAIKLAVAQKSCTRLLDAINKHFFPCGNVGHGSLYVWSTSAKRIIGLIYPYSIVKKKQYDNVLKARALIESNGLGQPKPPKLVKQLKKLAKECKLLKRT